MNGGQTIRLFAFLRPLFMQSPRSAGRIDHNVFCTLPFFSFFRFHCLFLSLFHCLPPFFLLILYNLSSANSYSCQQTIIGLKCKKTLAMASVNYICVQRRPCTPRSTERRKGEAGKCPVQLKGLTDEPSQWPRRGVSAFKQVPTDTQINIAKNQQQQ